MSCANPRSLPRTVNYKMFFSVSRCYNVIINTYIYPIYVFTKKKYLCILCSIWAVWNVPNIIINNTFCRLDVYTTRAFDTVLPQVANHTVSSPIDRPYVLISRYSEFASVPITVQITEVWCNVGRCEFGSARN